MLFILLGALVSIFCSFLPYYIQLFLAGAALVYGGGLIWRGVLLKAQNAIVTLTCCEDHSWQLKERSGKSFPASLCGDSTRLSFVSVLRFNCSLEGFKKKKRSAIIFQDAVSAPVYRQLLMKLGTIKIH
jgi:hypothetical protein